MSEALVLSQWPEQFLLRLCRIVLAYINSREAAAGTWNIHKLVRTYCTTSFERVVGILSHTNVTVSAELPLEEQHHLRSLQSTSLLLVRQVPRQVPSGQIRPSLLSVAPRECRPSYRPPRLPYL